MSLILYVAPTAEINMRASCFMQSANAVAGGTDPIPMALFNTPVHHEISVLGHFHP